jgi:hypothetical protein
MRLRDRLQRLAVEILYLLTEPLVSIARTPRRDAKKARPRLRFTVRRMMAGVVLAAVACLVGVSLLRHFQAEGLARQEADLLGWAAQYEMQMQELRGLASGDGRARPETTSRLADELRAAAADARRRAKHVRRKRLRCERAARRPWLAVAPEVTELE